MLKNNNELEKVLKNFCNRNKIDINIFEIARIGKGEGSTERKVLYGPKNVQNENCTYVIKLFLKYDLIIIWNYKNNKAMSYSYKAIEEKLKKGIFCADKGKGFHTFNQSEIFFEHSDKFEILLNNIFNKI